MSIAIVQYIVWFIFVYFVAILFSFVIAIIMHKIFFDKNYLQKPFNWDMSANEYLTSVIIVNVFSVIIAFVILWITYLISHDQFLWFNIITSYITNTNLQHFINQQLTYFTQTTSLYYLQFVAPATGLSVSLSMFRSIFLKKYGNFYRDFIMSILLLSALTFVVTILFNLLGLSFGYSFSFMAGIKNAPLSLYNAITLLGNNGGSYITEGIAAGPLMPNSLTAFLDIIVLNVLPFSLIFLIGIVTKNIKLSVSLLIAILTFFFVFNLIILDKTYVILNLLIPADLNEYSSLSLFYSSISTNTGATVFPLNALSPVQLAAFITLMLSDSLPGSVGSGFISLIFIIVITIFFSALMSGRMPKLFGYKLEYREIKYAVLGYIFHFALVLTAIPLIIFTLHQFNFSPGYDFTKLLWEVVSASVNNGSDFYGVNGNISALNIITGMLMLLGRYVPFYFGIKMTESFINKDKSFTKSDLKLDSLYFSFSLVFFIFLLVIISLLPLLALGPLSMG
ncbi:MAG: potassium-transporting ATPase subunit KdpA [Nitrososphaeria archaeon]